MKRQFLAGVCIAVLTALLAGQASAALLFDRGLPTANLNNAAGASRSNVTWAFTADPTEANPVWLFGDDFTLAQNSYVETIRVWTTSAPSTSQLSLWFGAAGGTFSTLSNPSVSVVTYADASTYQTGSGIPKSIYQLDFNVGQVLSGATTYQFFLEGTMKDGLGQYSPPYTYIVDAFIHSSNAALSGSTQQGSDNLLLAANVIGTGLAVDVPFTSQGYGWDKASDVNVQVYGAPVPIPAAAWLLGTGLIGLVGVRRRMQK